MSIDLRAPLASPVPDGYRRLTSSPRVVVHHPGYPDDNTNELFALVATDGSSSAPGVQHGVVHTACAIFACNRFDGWLSATRDASERHAVAPQGLLPVGDYYFHVPPEDSTVNEFANPTLSPYPIIPTFRFWPFPHSQTPAPWKDALIEERLAPEPAKQRDGTCRVTNHRESTESAHIIPASEKDWFGVNNMDKYSIWDSRRDQEVVNGDENVILLREDVHTLWDRMCFSFVPKLTSDDTCAWVVHVHKPSQEMHALYHNLQLQPLTGIRHEFLLARFAWDIYPSLQGFLQRMVTRRLKLPSGVEDVSGMDCKGLCEKQGYGRSSPTRSTSRKQSPKRKHGDMEEECGEEPYDTDSAISGMSPGTRYWAKTIESDTGNGAGLSNNDNGQDCFGLRRRKRQRLVEALVSDVPSNCSRMKRRLSEGECQEEDRGRTQARQTTRRISRK
jgi:hypothetical protein